MPLSRHHSTVACGRLKPASGAVCRLLVLSPRLRLGFQSQIRCLHNAWSVLMGRAADQPKATFARRHWTTFRQLPHCSWFMHPLPCPGSRVFQTARCLRGRLQPIGRASAGIRPAEDIGCDRRNGLRQRGLALRPAARAGTGLLLAPHASRSVERNRSVVRYDRRRCPQSEQLTQPRSLPRPLVRGSSRKTDDRLSPRGPVWHGLAVCQGRFLSSADCF
jgi:hypothetical protein